MTASTLRPIERETICLFFPHYRDLETIDLSKKKLPRQILAACLKQIVKLGFYETCPRCGGTGRYSYNPMFGDTCFNCGTKQHTPGSGKVAPRLTKKLLAQVAEKLALQGK